MSFSKDGYEPKDTLVTVTEDLHPEEDNLLGDTKLYVRLSHAQAFFYGNVMQNSTTPLNDVEVTFTKSTGEVRSALAANSGLSCICYA